MGCSSSSKKGLNYSSASVKPETSRGNESNKNTVISETPPIIGKKFSGKNKFGLQLNLADESTNDAGTWVDDFAECVDDDYTDSDEDDTGKGGWQLTSPLSQKKRLHDLMKRKHSGSMTPQSPSLAKLKTAVFKSIVLGQKRVNNYIIVKSLGEGAAGKVKLVEDADSNKLFAMKIQNLSVKKTLGQRRNFGADKEIAIMKKLNHPNIVKLYEVLESKKDNKIYMILEYNEQGPVMTLRQDGTCEALSIETSRKYIHDVVSGLFYLHYNGIVHQDLKPSNLLLKKSGSVAISDFGVSENSVGSKGNLLGVAGTPAFQAPEVHQANSNEDYISGFAADMWSLGIIVYAFVAGKLPFWGTDSLGLARSIMFDDIIIPESIVNQKLRNFMRGLLERNLDKRLTIGLAAVDPWITCDGAEPVLQVNSKINVSNAEIYSAITSINFGDIVKLKTKMGGNLKRIRKKIGVRANSKPYHVTKGRKIKKVEHNFRDSADGNNFLKVRDSATSYRAIQLPTEDHKLLSVENVENFSRGKDVDPNFGSLKKSKTGTIYNETNTKASNSSDDDWDDEEEVHEVTDILQEIGEVESTKRFTFNMTHERLKIDIDVQNISFFNEALNLAYSVKAEQNRLNYMEDRHVVISEFMNDLVDGEQRLFAYFGVYDGHGGHECADFLKLSLDREILSRNMLWEKPEEALLLSFKAVQDKFSKYAEENSIYSGSTACVALISKEKYIFANVGDSRAIISRLGRVSEVTVDHKPALQAEMERIHRAGGRIANNRVQGVLSVSRSFGDIEYNSAKEQSWGKNFADDLIIATPDVFVVQRLPEQDEFLIIASDGLWDAFPSQKVVNMFRQYLADTGGLIDAAVEKLVQEAKSALQSPDNITVVAVVFNSVSSCTF